MARTLSTAGHGAIFPVGTGDFVKRRLCEAAGLLILTLAAALLVAFFSYSPADPSLNSASGGDVRNLAGRAGAVVADAFLQFLGLAAGVPALALAAWGWLLLGKRTISHPWIRVVAVLVACVLVAIAASAVASIDGWPLATRMGGVIGTVLADRIHALTKMLHIAVDGHIVAAAFGVMGAIALVYASAVSISDWHAGMRATAAAWQFAKRSFGWTRDKVSGVSWKMPFRFAYPAQAERIEPSLGRRAHGIDAGDAETEDDEPRLARANPDLVAPKAPKPKTGKRAEKLRQGKLPLAEGEYSLPPLDLLDKAAEKKGQGTLSQDALEQNAKMLSSVLDDFGVKGEIVKVRPGPVVTLYELEPAPGTKTSRVIGLSDDIARSMSAVSVRVAVVPGRNAIGIELPNAKREMVYLRELLASEALEKSGGKLPLAVGKDIGGAPVIVDLARMPHLLIAGTTGSGKSVAMNTMVLSLLYQLSPDQCKFIMIDPKMLELSVYDGIPHLLCPVVTEPGKAVVALKWTVREMEERYRAMSQLGVRNIAGYNARLAEAKKKGESLSRRVQTGFDDDGKPIFEDQPLATDPLPFIVVVVDEMADLMLVAGKDIEAAVQRLAQMARAAGIHIIMATQRPSVDVITGTIKANFPTRISFQVTSKIDSRTILGEQGAEQLLGQGDMLYMAGGGRITRVHGPFVSDEEVEGVVSYLKSQAEPDYLDAVTEEEEPEFEMPGGIGGGQAGDDLYDQAVALVAREGKASTSFVQRYRQIGYNRAARIIERMEAEGVVSKANRVGRREVLVGDHSG